MMKLIIIEYKNLLQLKKVLASGSFILVGVIVVACIQFCTLYAI